MKSLLKTMMVWTLTILIGVEPAVFAANKGVNQDIKAFLEQSGITQKSMTLQEFYKKNSAYLPADARAQIEPFVRQFPNYEIPKVDVNKVSGPNGEEVYQVQAVKDGQSVSMAIHAGGEVFAKFNGVNISASDLFNVRAVMVKAGVAQADAEKYFPERRSGGLGGMTQARLLKLSSVQRKQYVRQLRQLLVSIEAVQGAGVGITTTSNQESKYEFFARIFTGEIAQAQQADGGKECIAAGYQAKVVWNKARPAGAGWACGSDGNGGVAEEYRGQCPTNQYQCNKVIFGSSAPCVGASRETTKECSTAVQNGKDDIPDTAQDRKNFFSLRDEAILSAKKLQAICGSSKYATSGLTTDQKYTCSRLDERLAEVESWDCNSSNYGKHTNLKKICESTPVVPGEPGNPEGPGNPGNPGNPNQPPTAAAGPIMCNKLPVDMSTNRGELEAKCKNGSVSNLPCNVASAPGELTSQDAYICKCEFGGTAPNNCARSEGTSQGSVGSDHGGHSGKSKSKWGKWLLMGGVALLGIFALHWLTKKAFKTSYEQYDPTTPQPPITVPPLPTTLPPPIPIAPGVH